LGTGRVGVESDGDDAMRSGARLPLQAGDEWVREHAN
jgi:hypothetical protein